MDRSPFVAYDRGREEIIHMIYTPLTNRAMRFAYAAHVGQVDKSGVPYIFHPYHLAEQMDGCLTPF